MANHKSALKNIRSDEAKRTRNRLQHKTMRNALRKFQDLTTKKAASKELPALISMIDKLAKRNIIHANKASNLKSQVTKHIATL
ncbi:MAG: 30S ribosomal protein S20 [Flavobacteriaceae bacterium]|jgi:small subunit ribosomal protein S20|nr:30S ribosomal protein S20 [Flavobacteriaceae bacterium]